MATKDAQLGVKRKAISGAKGKLDGKAKKARLGDSKSSKVTKDQSDDFGDFSDSDSDSDSGGGVMLEATPAVKPSRKNDAAARDHGVDRSGLTSREAHAKQKQLAQERKAAKPLADEVHRTKKIWERLRMKSHVPKNERQKLVKELFEIVSGRCRDFVLKHDATRAVQTAIKYSTPDQRKQIARELEGSYAQLAESRYAKFLIGKLLVHNDGEIRDLVIPNFYSKVRKLINHAEASWILDDVYRTVATKEQKAILLREWYGPEFSLREMVKGNKPTADLKQILGEEPNKRGPIMKFLMGMINALVQKKMTGFTMLHDAMLQYFHNTQVGSSEFEELLALIKGDDNGDLLKNMAFTKSGARLTCLLLAHGSSKDRKQILKTYKDCIILMSGDVYAHVVILTAYDVIDDTKLVSKAIFPELLGDKDEDKMQNVIAAVNNSNARTTMLYLFEGLSSSLFPASHAFDLETLKEVQEIRKTTSKKDNDVRRKELVAVLAPHLLSVIAAASGDLTMTAFGCQFITTVLLTEMTEDKTKALEAVAQSAAGNPQKEPLRDEESVRPHISRLAFGGRMLKSLIQGGRFDKLTGKVVQVQPPLEFSKVLYPVIKDSTMDWATGPSSFVVLALVETGNFQEVDALRQTLRKNKKTLEKAATEMPTGQKKTNKEARDISSSKKGDEKGSEKSGSPSGNLGCRLLLKNLQ